MEALLLIIGIVLFVSGVTLHLSINRRRFYRRGPGGLQHFDNYRKAVGISFLERIGKVLAFLLILAGVIFMAAYFILPEMITQLQQQAKQH